jgi:hypothetical protein
MSRAASELKSATVTSVTLPLTPAMAVDVAVVPAASERRRNRFWPRDPLPPARPLTTTSSTVVPPKRAAANPLI